MASLILGHVLEVMDRPWKWGEADCCTAACDVFHRLTGIDPMANLRGRYRTAIGARRMIRNFGGMAALASTQATRYGLHELAAPVPGAIGVVDTDAGDVLAVCISPGVWAAKTTHGFTSVSAVRRFWHVANS